MDSVDKATAWDAVSAKNAEIAKLHVRIASDAKRIAELEARLDAADAITRAIKLDRLQMAGTITMDEIRLRTGEGRLSYGTILWAVNKILSERATPTVNEKGE